MRQIKILRQMSQCLGSSLENDIRLHASGSEKVYKLGGMYSVLGTVLYLTLINSSAAAV